MKFLHLSDLHIGKRVNEVSMLDDQSDILKQILELADAERPDAVLLAGDIYDKSVPSNEAVALFDDFLVQLAARRLPVLLISGNHDSPERLAFGARLLDASGIYISPVYHGDIRPVTLTDADGPVRFWLLPFIKPAHVKRFFPDETIESYTDACRAAIAQMKDGAPVWFGCDVGKCYVRDEGILDLSVYEPGSLFGTDFPMTKSERLDYGQSLLTHAMVFEGVNLDENGKPNRWRVENSWGKDVGHDGYFVMSDAWFDEYLYQVVVNRKYLTVEELAEYESEPITLEPWDPMGSLAL